MYLVSIIHMAAILPSSLGPLHTALVLVCGPGLHAFPGTKEQEQVQSQINNHAEHLATSSGFYSTLVSNAFGRSTSPPLPTAAQRLSIVKLKKGAVNVIYNNEGMTVLPSGASCGRLLKSSNARYVFSIAGSEFHAAQQTK